VTMPDTPRPLAARGPDGLAIIGRTLHDLRGIRFDTGEGGNAPAAPAAPAPSPAPAPAPANPPTPAPPANPAPAAAPPANPPAPPADPNDPEAPVGGVAFADLPAETQQEVRRLRQADRANRAALAAGMTEERRTELGKLLGFVDEQPDPAAVTARVSELTSTNAELARANMVLLTALDAGARAASLLDSKSFTESIAGLEPTDKAGITAAIQTWLTAHPEHRATAGPALPPTPGSPGHTGDKSAVKPGLEGAIASALNTTPRT